MCCVYEQHEGGANPTESMTRALISDDSIARQGTTLGPVQLGYVSSITYTDNSIVHFTIVAQMRTSYGTFVVVVHTNTQSDVSHIYTLLFNLKGHKNIK